MITSFYYNMKISTKIYAGFFLVLGLLVILGGYGIFSIKTVGNKFIDYRHIARANVLISTIEENILRASLTSQKYRAKGDETLVEEFNKYI